MISSSFALPEDGLRLGLAPASPAADVAVSILDAGPSALHILTPGSVAAGATFTVTAGVYDGATRRTGGELAAVLEGGEAVTMRDDGVALLVSHTVRDNEIKFGYAITGEVDPARVLSNAGAKAGDLLVLRSIFVVKRSDFGIKIDTPVDTVADEIQISAAVVGARKTG